MGIPRLIRVNELLKREIAEGIHRCFSGTGFDVTPITVTRVKCAPDLRDANVYISIFKREDDREKMVDYLNRHRQEIVQMMVKHVKLKYTPRLRFMLDKSIEEGDNVLSILHTLEQQNPGLNDLPS